MSDAAVTDDPETHDHEGHEHHAHEGEAFSGHEVMYLKVALLLAVMTGMEVAWPYIIDDGPVLMWPLLIVMSIKFVVIAAFFMHLRFDSIILTRIFYAGLFLAVAVYVVALTTFHVWSS